MYKYFKGLDLGDFFPGKNIPDTDIKKEYKLQTTPLPITYIQYYLETNSNEDGILDEMKKTITPIELFEDFNLYKNTVGETKHYTLHQFQLSLTKSCLSLKAEQHGKKDRTRKYHFPEKTDDILDILKANNMYNANL